MSGLNLAGVLRVVRGHDLGEELAQPAEAEVLHLRDLAGRLRVQRDEARAAADRMAAALQRILADHRPYVSGAHEVRRCLRCPVGADPGSGRLIHDTWPCPAAQAAADALGVAL